MKSRCAAIAFLVVIAGVGLVSAQPAGPADPSAPPPAVAQVAPVPLEWVPPALSQLSAQASGKSSFTLDRSMLSTAAGLYGDMDADTRQAINKLDGVSVHILRFNDESVEDPVLLAEIRDAYHLKGWKHVISAGDSGAYRDSSTDVWVVMEGSNLRGAVVLVQSPKSVTLATVSGNLSPIDLLHLRGHFGIPRFDGDRLEH